MNGRLGEYDLTDVDCRLPEYRAETFLRFYEFHVRYKAHPGGVYHFMPYLRDAYEWDDEAALWFAFINGNTQHPMTSAILFEASNGSPRGAEAMIEFWTKEYTRLAFDTDRRYHKKNFGAAVRSLLSLSKGSPADYWYRAAEGGWPGVWDACRAVYSFGRLSAFSFAEYLRIMGLPFDCEDLLVGDSGSGSHRNGLAIVSGHEEWDHHKSNPGFDGCYTSAMVGYLSEIGATLLEEARHRMPNEKDVSYFTLESALCTYKSWHRPNRRYPNVYNDMAYDRLKSAEAAWPEFDFSDFWNARWQALPAHLRLEDTPGDPGICPAKQNFYRQTGRPIMMHKDYPDLQNEFNDCVDAEAWGTFR